MRHVTRHSLIWKLFFSVLLCTVLLFVVNWLLNNFALVSYYGRQKEKILVESFEEINSMYGRGDELQENRLYQLSNSQNVNVIIWDGRTVLYEDRPGGWRDRVLWFPSDRIAENGGYLLETKSDEKMGSSFITLWGILDNGYCVRMQTPVAAIEESVDITNRFLILSGSVTLLVGLVVVLAIARSFTRPVEALSRIAGGMAQLDFSERYDVKGSDELSDLGRSVNRMSEVLERTISELRAANEQLREENEQKTRQNEARRAFIANVSHELKTPIALIQTYAEGLREDIAAGAGNRDSYCEVIEDEAAKMSGLIGKMTALMQLEDGSGQLEPERFDIAELLRNLMSRNVPLFEKRGITPVLPPEVPCFVEADAYLIENVLVNYLSNALHHVPDGGRVEGWIAPSEEGRLRISVFNTGRHIPQTELPRIWESFYKVDKARTRAYGGSGIGLSLVAAVMKAHHMPYGVVNRVLPTADGGTDCGVEFYIELESRP